MDGHGSPVPDVSRLHAEDATYSPSRSPPLLQSVSGNDSSSGSPSGSRRHGSTGEKDRKNRDERLKLMKERQEQQHERRLADLKATYEKEQRVRQLKDAERLRRIQEIKMKEAQRRQAVEERRRRLETEDKEKREQILAKYREYENRLNSQRDQKKPVYAFGSSTPRTLAYLEHLENSMRVYNSRLSSATGAEEDSVTAAVASAKGASTADKRATSACSLTRKPLTASSSPNLSPQHQQQQRAKLTGDVHRNHRSPKIVLAPSGRWGGSMVASMYGGSAATAPIHAAHVDPLANVHSMTTSFAVGETSAASHAKNVRTKGPLSPAASARSQSTPRLARSSATPRKARQQDVITEESEDGTGCLKTTADSPKSTGAVPKRNGSDSAGEGAPSVAGSNQKAKGVSSARTPSAPPPAIRRPVGDAASKHITAPASSKHPPSKEKSKSSTSQKPPLPTGEGVKVIRKPKPSTESSTPEHASPAAARVSPRPEAAVHSPNEVKSVSQSIIDQSPVAAALPSEEPILDVNSIRLEDDHLGPYEQTKASEEMAHIAAAVEENHDHGDNYGGEGLLADFQNTSDLGMLSTSMDNLDLSTSTTELVPGVPKPTGHGGKVLSKEEATAALAERRRLAREQMEREKELERQREEQRRLDEEEARRREEEEFRRQEEEELRALEEARRLEAERIRKLIEEEEKRRDEEIRQKEEEQRKKVEAEARAREEAEKAEQERKEAEEKFKKEELERSERKKKLEAIMKRTRQSAGTVTPIGKQQQQGGSGHIFSNGNSDHANDSVYATPDMIPTNANTSPTHSASASVLQKLANVRPEVGRSLENILNRGKSTPTVNDAEHVATTNESLLTVSAMTASFSADKVGHSPANGDARLTQSFYATPADHLGDHSFNYSDGSGGERTQYDVDGTESTKSESHYATILFNQEIPEMESGGMTAALASIPGTDSDRNLSNIVPNIVDSSGEPSRHFFDHNENVNSASAAAPNGHGGERASASDSDASSAVTVVHQKLSSPRDVSFDDPFSSPKRTSNKFDDLINDNLSTPDGSIGQPANVVQSPASHKERPLMEF